MSRRTYGVFIAGPGKSVDSGRLIYRSDRPRLQVDLTRDPAHMQIIESMIGGTALVAATDDTVYTEILLTIPHGLPYCPEAMAFFFVKSKNGNSIDPPASAYYGGIFYFSGTGAYTDAIYLVADETNVYLKHSISTPFGSPVTSDADDHILRVKLYIYSNDSHVSAYDYYEE